MSEHRPIRRSDRAMPEDQGMSLLTDGNFGVLSTVGEEGKPYGVPLSYVVMDGAIYFHCAKTGHKIDNMAYQPQVSFCVCGEAVPFYNGTFTTTYESVIISGRAEIVSDRDEKERALTALCVKYLPDHADKIQAAVGPAFDVTALYRITIEHMTGKHRTQE